MQAWMEALVHQHDATLNTFTEREAFIELWRDSPFGLFWFDRYAFPRMKKRVDYLYAKLSTLDVATSEDFIARCRAGAVSDEDFQRLAPIIALQWVIQAENTADNEQHMIDAQAAEDKAKLELERREKEYKQARGKAVYYQYCLAIGIPLPDEDEDEDEFDPFPDQPHPPMSSVDWEGGLLSSLL